MASTARFYARRTGGGTTRLCSLTGHACLQHMQAMQATTCTPQRVAGRRSPGRRVMYMFMHSHCVPLEAAAADAHHAGRLVAVLGQHALPQLFGVLHRHSVERVHDVDLRGGHLLGCSAWGKRQAWPQGPECTCTARAAGLRPPMAAQRGHAGELLAPAFADGRVLGAPCCPDVRVVQHQARGESAQPRIAQAHPSPSQSRAGRRARRGARQT